MSNGNQPETRPIRDVVDDTGVSKELIHYYIREGLLPRPTERAKYSDNQVRLLHQIKKLRDKHNLPLDLLRRIFELFDHDPDQLEPLTLVVSLSARMQALAESGDLSGGRMLSAEALAAEAGVGPDRLEEYREARLISALGANGGAIYTPYDANVIALCERGRKMGIPFDTFRAIGSYTRVGFELEHTNLLQPERLEMKSQPPTQILRELFIRREIAVGFVQNLLHAMVQARLKGLVEPPTVHPAPLSRILFHPSAQFIKKHRLDKTVQSCRDRLTETPDALACWSELAHELIGAGDLRQAAFFLEQARERWPSDLSLRLLHGKTLISVGKLDEGLACLEPMIENNAADPLARIYYALGMFAGDRFDRENQEVVERSERILTLVDSALDSAGEAVGQVACEARMLGGWLYTALPEIVGRPKQGVSLLYHTVSELIAQPALEGDRPALGERRLANAAYLLFECLSRSLPHGARSDLPTDIMEKMRQIVCRIDPAGAFAEFVFLNEGP